MNNVSLIITTSPIKIHPNTTIIDKVIHSIEKMNYNFKEKIISYDTFIEKDEDSESVNQYNQYKKIMKEKYTDYKHIELEKHEHFIGSLYNTLKICKSKFFFLVQHDIELKGIYPIDKFLNNKYWDIIATHHLKKGLTETHFYPININRNKYLFKSYGWSERIFLSKRDFMIKKIEDMYKENRKKYNFIDLDFNREFKKLYKKNEKINNYKDIDYNNNIQLYENYWIKWRCFNIKKDFCYHIHLCGRTTKNIL